MQNAVPDYMQIGVYGSGGGSYSDTVSDDGEGLVESKLDKDDDGDYGISKGGQDVD